MFGELIFCCPFLLFELLLQLLDGLSPLFWIYLRILLSKQDLNQTLTKWSDVIINDSTKPDNGPSVFSIPSPFSFIFFLDFPPNSKYLF